MNTSWVFLCALCALCGSTLPAFAADPTYWADVRPILRKHCTVCHSERKLAEPEVSAGLALDSLAGIRKERKGTTLAPGKPDQSLLVTLLTSKDKKRAMPLDADPLPTEDIAVIRKWVELGAPEGTKPKDDDQAAPVARAVKKLDVTFATKALSLTLPVGPLPPVAAVAFSPEGKFLASGVYGRVTVWDLSAAKPTRVLTNVLGAVNDVKFSPDGKLLAVAGGQPSARGDLRLFDTSTWKLVGSLGGHLDTVSGVAFSPDGTKLASASFDKTVRLWDVKSGRVLHTFTGHSDFVYAVAFSPDGTWYATASKDRTGRVVDAATGTGKLTFSGMDLEVLAVAVRPDGQAVTSGFEPQLHWWDTTTAERLRRTGGPGVAAHEIALDAKGTIVAVAGGDGTVRTFDAKTGAALRAIQAGSPVFAVAVSPTGKLLASGAADGTLKAWDATDGRLLATFWSDAAEWLCLVPEGYASASDGVWAKGVWKAGGKPADAKFLAALKDAAQVVKALAGQKVTDAAVAK